MAVDASRERVGQGTIIRFKRSGDLKAQLLVPKEGGINPVVSFFWPGWTSLDTVHALIEQFFLPQTDFKLRVVQTSYVSDFEFSPVTGEESEAGLNHHHHLAHQIIPEPGSPSSIRMCAETLENRSPRAIYMWATLGSGDWQTLSPRPPEAGIRCSLQDWNLETFDKVLIPAFRGTVHLDREDARDLWESVPSHVAVEFAAVG